MKFFLTLILFCACAFCGCADKYAVQTTQSMQELETILRRNVDHPDNLIPALDAYIEKYQDLWNRNQHVLELHSVNSIKREVNVQLKYLDESYRNILDLDLEIQDTLQDNPEMLHAYQERVRRIGRVNQ